MKATIAAAVAAATGVSAQSPSPKAHMGTPNSLIKSAGASPSWSTYTWTSCESDAGKVATATGTVTETKCHECPEHTSVWTTDYEYPCETGMKQFTTTMTETCNSPMPTWSHTMPGYKPPGWMVSTVTCTKCAETPVTKTITYPTHNPSQTPEASSPGAYKSMAPGGGHGPGPGEAPSSGGGAPGGMSPGGSSPGGSSSGGMSPGGSSPGGSSPGGMSPGGMSPGGSSPGMSPGGKGWTPSESCTGEECEKGASGWSGSSPSSPMASSPAGSGPAGKAGCPGAPGCEGGAAGGWSPPAYKNQTAAVEYTGDSSIVSPWRSISQYIVVIGAVAAGAFML